LSRIIKGYEVHISQPKVIQIDEIRELQQKIENTGSRNSKSIKSVPNEIEQIKQESEEIIRETEAMIVDLLDKARVEAASIVSRAHEEAAQIREENMEKGYTEGRNNALQEIDEIRRKAVEESEKIIEQSQQSRIQILKSCEADMMRLVMAIARKVIDGEVQTNPDVIINVISEALCYLDKTENITVHINVNEVLKVMDAVNTGLITDKNQESVDLEVEADKKISPGGCIIDSEEGQIDATIETRINRLEGAVQEVIGNA